MSDDSFIREVNEELRQDQAKALWERYGMAALGVALFVVLVTGAWVAYDYWQSNRANASGDAYSQALALAAQGDNDAAMEALRALEDDGVGAYPLLARMRAATVLHAQGDADGAVAAFDAVAGDGSIPMSIRDMARLRAALILVDHGDHAEVASRVEPLSADTNPLRHSAREALALSAWKEGRLADALTLFEQVTEDQSAPRNVRERCQMMAELIRGSGVSSS